MGYQIDEVDGHITDQFIYFVEAIAKGGVGLQIVEGGTLDFPQGAHDVFHFRIDDDEYIPGWTKVAEASHKHGVPIFAQMVHAGPWHRTEMSGLQPIASSANIKVEEAAGLQRREKHPLLRSKGLWKNSSQRLNDIVRPGLMELR